MQMVLSLLMSESVNIEVEPTVSTLPEAFWETTVMCTVGLSILIVWQFWFGGKKKDPAVWRGRRLTDCCRLRD